MNEKSVDYRFKVLYAVAMIMVVCSHCYGGGVSVLLNDWFPYMGHHLALFAFGSGYFYKDSSENNSIRYVGKKIKTLIIPLYVYTIIYGLFVQVMRTKGFTIGGPFNFHNVVLAPLNDGHQFVYTTGGWFVVPLFLVEVYTVFVRKLVHKISKKVPEIVFLLLSVVLGLVGNTLACNGFTFDWWVVLIRMLYFLPFYSFGIFYNRVLEKYDKLPSFWYFTILFIIRGAIIYYYGTNIAYIPSWCRDFTEGPVMPMIIGLLGIALWMRISTVMEPVLGRSKWINLIADNTYSIMMNQFLGFMFVKTLFAGLSKYAHIFQDFDWASYKSDISWYFKPRSLDYSLIIYVVAGIAVSIIIQKIIDFVKARCCKLIKREVKI